MRTTLGGANGSSDSSAPARTRRCIRACPAWMSRVGSSRRCCTAARRRRSGPPGRRLPSLSGLAKYIRRRDHVLNCVVDPYPADQAHHVSGTPIRSKPSLHHRSQRLDSTGKKEICLQSTRQQAWSANSGKAPAKPGLNASMLTARRFGQAPLECWRCWLARAPTPSVSSARSSGSDRSTLVSLVMDGLEEMGPVVRWRDRKDRRRYELTLTKIGRQALFEAEGGVEGLQEAVLKPLDDAGRRELHKLLTAMFAGFGGEAS